MKLKVNYKRKIIRGLAKADSLDIANDSRRQAQVLAAAGHRQDLHIARNQ